MQRQRVCGRWAAVLAAAVWFAPAGAQAGEELSGEVVIVLAGAIAQGTAQGGQPLIVRAACDNGTWGDVWGECRTYNQAVHDGRVLEAEASGDRIRLKVELSVRPDSWVSGGCGEYTIDVTAKPSKGVVDSGEPALRTAAAVGELNGTYKGTFRSSGGAHEGAGAAVGIILPPRKLREGFVPFKAGEHPRLLFRAAELPALRQKAATPFGKALAGAMGASKSAVALGLMYRLTGEAKYAAQAVADVDHVMSQLGGSEIYKCHQWGVRMTTVALAYDLCVEAWDAPYRKKVVEYLYKFASRAFENPWDFGSAHSSMMANHGAHHVMGLFSGAGMAGLALWGIPGPEPKSASSPLANLLAQRFAKKAGPSVSGFDLQRKDTEIDHAIWKAHDGADPRYVRLGLRGRRSACLNSLMCMGEGGFQGEGEGYTLGWNDVVFDYTLAYWNAFGRPASSRPTATHFVPRYVMTSVWGEKGRPVNLSFGVGDGAAGADYVSRVFAYTPEAWRPAVQWYWLKCLGTTAEEIRTQAGAEKVAGRLARDGLTLAYTFVHYPLASAPANPGEVMPRFWHARTRGFCCFRNAWQGADDVVAQIHARQGPGVGFGQPEAGCFQIYGLGHVWACKPVKGSRAFRYMDNVVLLPDDANHDGGRGVVTHVDAKTDGGTVTMNLDDVYRLVRAEGKSRTIYDGGIRGLRSFAADYSGKAGAAALFAVVDRVKGGQTKQWVMHLPASASDVAVKGNTFTVKQGDASLTGTFVAPAGVKLEHLSGTTVGRLGKAGIGRIPFRLNAVKAGGDDPTAGDFFVVMTLQKGAAPAVQADGAGLTAKVTVGRQTVAFDGTKIVLGG